MLIAYIWKRWNRFPFYSAFHGEDVKRAKRITESVGHSHNLQGGYQTRFKKTKRRHYLPSKVRLQALRGRKCQLKHTTTCIALKGIIRTTSPASIRLMTRTFLFLKYSHITFMNTKKSESHLWFHLNSDS